MEGIENSKSQEEKEDPAVRTAETDEQEVAATQDSNARESTGGEPRSNTQMLSVQPDSRNSAHDNALSRGAAQAVLDSAALAADGSGQVPNEAQSYQQQVQSEDFRNANILSILAAIQTDHSAQNVLESMIIDQLSLALLLERRRAQLTAELHERLQAQVLVTAQRMASAQASNLHSQPLLAQVQPSLRSELQWLQRIAVTGLVPPNQQVPPPNQPGPLPASGLSVATSVSSSNTRSVTNTASGEAKTDGETWGETVVPSSRQGESSQVAQGGSLEPTQEQSGEHSESFPRKLYRLLVEVEAAGKDDIISFERSGRAFRIHRPKAFMEEIVPNYFRQKKIGSFKRQLQLYGFHRIPLGPEEGAYAHKNFQRGRPDLVATIVRIR